MKNNISKEKILKMLNFFIKNIELWDFDFNKLDKIDYYWDIVDNEKLYNPYEENISKYISLWQISEDWDSLSDLVNWKADRDLIFHDYKLLSNIIRLLEYIKK